MYVQAGQTYWQEKQETSSMLCVGSTEYCRGKKGSLFMNLTGQYINLTHLHFEPPFLMKSFGQYKQYFALFFCQSIH